uniref:Secreted protein n=1 Tax=Globodera rostochiensis TaxID=31243 RepID=A0A914I2R7_GLORO
MELFNLSLWICMLCIINCISCANVNELSQNTDDQNEHHGSSPILSCLANCRKRHFQLATRDFCYRKVCGTITAAYEEATAHHQ